MIINNDKYMVTNRIVWKIFNSVKTIYICFVFFVDRIDWHSLRSVRNFITGNYWLINKTFHLSMSFKIFINLTIIRTRIWSITFFTHTVCYWFLHSHWHLLLFHFKFELRFLLSNLHLQLHQICLANVFDSFLLVTL